MLADAVEGATRALPKPTPDRIEQTARRIIRDKLDDGQLNESNLSFRHLDVIARPFSRLLATMFHPRIEYPELQRDLRAGQRDRAPAPCLTDAGVAGPPCAPARHHRPAAAARRRATAPAAAVRRQHKG